MKIIITIISIIILSGCNVDSRDRIDSELPDADVSETDTEEVIYLDSDIFPDGDTTDDDSFSPDGDEELDVQVDGDADGDVDSDTDVDGDTDADQDEEEDSSPADAEIDSDIPLVCPDDLTNCDGECVTLDTVDNCGSCGRVCEGPDPRCTEDFSCLTFSGCHEAREEGGWYFGSCPEICESFGERRSATGCDQEDSRIAAVAWVDTMRECNPEDTLDNAPTEYDYRDIADGAGFRINEPFTFSCCCAYSYYHP